MALHGSRRPRPSQTPPTRGPRTVRRRPTLPGVQRAQVPIGRLGDPRSVPSGLEAFAGFEGLQRPPSPGGTTRGTPQERADLERRLAATQRNLRITPSSSLRGPGPGSPPGIGDQLGPNSQLGPDTGGLNPPATGGFGGLGGVRQGGFSFGGGLGTGETGRFATPAGILAAQQGRGVQFPGPGEGFGSLDAAGIAARQLDPRTGRPLEQPADRTRPGLSGTLPPVPFQSFDDFFAMRRLQRQAEIQEQNPFPFGGGFRFTPEQARIRAAGGDPGESTFIGAPGQQATGGVPGAGGGPAGVAPPGPIQQAGSPTGAFGSGGSQRDVEPTGLAGFNAGLLENQAIFAALRDALLQRLIPQALGV